MAQLTESDNEPEGSSPADPEAQIECDQEKNFKQHTADPTAMLAETDSALSNWRKPLSFYMAFLSLAIIVLIVSLDATANPSKSTFAPIHPLMRSMLCYVFSLILSRHRQ